MPNKGFVPILIFIVVAAIGIAGYFSYKNYLSNKTVACTLEARICPDGSAVGRVGPKCEFAACPSSTPSKSGSCKPNFPVEVNSPELTASQNYAMECNLKQNKTDCEKVDIYNSFNKDFTKPDGINDCDWIPVSVTPLPGGNSGKSCGGIAGIKCPSGMECKITDKYPDAMGTCVTQTKYTCPASGWVDCMPIVDESRKAACSPDAMDWYKINCPDFKGAAY